MPRNQTPMETPGFAWRIGLSIIVVFGWAAFIILWLFFLASDLNTYQNIALFFVSVIIGIAVLAAAWASWGMKYGCKFKNMQKGKSSVKVCEKVKYDHGCGGAVYGLGFIGALVYYITTAPTFMDAVIGFIKAILWPAFLVYGVLKTLGL
jgi:hypothetical protein